METGLTKPHKTLILCSAFIAGTGTAIADFSSYLLITSVIMACALAVLAIKKFLSLRLALIAAGIFAFSAFYTGYRTPEPDGLYSISQRQLELRGKVISEPRDDMPAKTKFYFKADKVKLGGNWEPARAKTIVYIYDKHRKFDKIKTGDLLELKGSVNPPYKATNPGEFNYGKYLNRKGIFTMTYVRYDNYKLIGNSGFSAEFFLDKLNRLRSKILDVHRKHLDSPKLELLGGMVFGDRAVPSPKYVEESFIKSGLLHLLAASGLNVGIIFGIWYFLASKAGLGFRVKIITGMLLVGLYSLLTGLPPSVTRATLMLEFVLIGKLMDRCADNSVLLVIVGVLMLLFNPLMIADVSFQLSFVVTLGLLMFTPLLVEKSRPIPEFLSGVFWVPFIAQVCVMPIQAFHFNTFAPYSILANMLVIPFVGIISSSGFAGSIFALIPFIGKYLCFIADKIAEPFIFLLLFISDFIAGLPGALIYVSKPGTIMIIAFYLLLAIVFIVLKNNFSSKKLNFTALIMLLILLTLVFKGNFSFKKELEFMFFDVGQGDSVLVKTPKKKYLLVDTGPPGKYSPAKTAIIAYLRDKGIKKLDGIVLTHPDNDHTGGTPDLLGEINVETLYHNGIKRETKNYKRIAKSILQNQVKTRVLKHNDRIELDDELEINVMRPNNTIMLNDNEDSLVLYIVYDDFSALLMADCEAGSLKVLKEKIKHPVNLLKVGHHGSHNSVNKEFMEYIKPEVSVVSVGKRGYHLNHPHPEVMGLLKEYDSRIFRTDRDYAIKISTDGENTRYTTFEQHKRMRL